MFGNFIRQCFKISILQGRYRHYGGKIIIVRDIFALGEELRQLTRKDADVFELRELNTGTPFYNTVMQEGVRIA